MWETSSGSFPISQPRKHWGLQRREGKKCYLSGVESSYENSKERCSDALVLPVFCEFEI